MVLDVNAANNDCRTPLLIAANGGHFKVVEKLLKRGANINAQGKKGNTSLHIAVGKEDLEIVRLLLAYGANINAKNKNGKTPLDLAVEEGHQEIITLLENAQRADQPLRSNLGDIATINYFSATVLQTP